MDVVLEIFDTFTLDRLYATLLPLTPSMLAFSTIDPLATSPNATWSSMREAATPAAYTFQPASQYLSFEPSSYAYMSRWPRDNIFRQFISLFLITWVFGLINYFVCAGLSYIFVFDKDTFRHPKYLKNQMRLEIHQALTAMPVIALLTAPWFVAEVRGYSFIYDALPESSLWNMGGWYNFLQFPFFLFFTDFCIYWIHRGLHHKTVYKHLHKPHHKWIMPTPFASHAFHPLDGYAQSIPYHVFPFLFPMQKFAYIALFMFVNIWTVLIHDGEYVANSPIINGAACHTMHHLFFNCNYGQYTTLWDRLGGSYRKPNDELFRRETKMDHKEWNKQAKEMEKIVKEVEGEDDRNYGPESKKIQ